MTIKSRHYWRCIDCQARFLLAQHWLSTQQEKTHYQTHENDPDDIGYRRYLSKLFAPMLDKIDEGSLGLDYGCGPGSALAKMFTEKGFDIQLYDPYFEPDTRPLQGLHDFITCTEVVEHFHRPAEQFDRLNRLLKPGGWLGIMTCFQTDDKRFENWHYRRDPTHVVFYRPQTFTVLAEQRDWHCEIPCKDVVLMRKAMG
jgi:SAM-dependent methyltransferase